MFYNAIKEKMKQITNTILMIQPIAFRYNEQTAVNNYYQQVLDGLSSDQTQKNALFEFNNFVDKLRNKGIDVIIVEDTKTSDTPDSIFPNNWVSFHESGNVAIYPMCAENRRDERRDDILDVLVDNYNFSVPAYEYREESKMTLFNTSHLFNNENMKEIRHYELHESSVQELWKSYSIGL